MRRGSWLLGAICLVAFACAAAPAVTVSMLAERVPAADQPFQEEDLDRMVAIILAAPSETEAEPSPAPPSGSTGATRSVESAAVATVAPSAPVATAAAAPLVATATPRPVPTAVPKVATLAPTSVAGCRFSQSVSDEDGTVRAAQAPPAVFYGGGLCAGDKVEAIIAGKSCGASTADAAGQWSISIRSSASCAPTENAAVTLTVNGKAATVSPPAQWKGGGLPPDIANGYALTR